MHLPLCSSLTLVALLLLQIPVQAAGTPSAVFPDPVFEFGRVFRGKVVDHVYRLRNGGSEPLRIQGIRMTAPLTIERSLAQVAPGAETEIRFTLDTASLQGSFEGEIVVTVNDPAQPEVTLAFEGIIVPEIEGSPEPAFWIVAQKGEVKTAELEIINHGAEPLRIEMVDHPKKSFDTHLETVEEGRRFRLTLILDRGAPSGKTREPITILTDSKKVPALKVLANLNIRERIYTFPEVVQLGALPMSLIQTNPGAVEQSAQTLMVYQQGGTDFQVKLHTDVPALDLRGERGPKGDRYQVTVSLIRDAVRPGPLEGSIYLETNDPDFPLLG